MEDIMFTINGKSIKSKYNYKIHPRTKVTTTIRTEYYNEYKNLMDKNGNSITTKNNDKLICK
jgi:hypothetical protein